MKCDNCGSRMKKVSTNPTLTYLCETCGQIATDDGNGGFIFEDIGWDSDEDSMPPGCAACGSDIYPICRGGCPLIDE